MHSYLSPSDKPGVSQFILQFEQVVNGRFRLALSDVEFSVRIVVPIIWNDAAFKKQHNYLVPLGDYAYEPTIARGSIRCLEEGRC